MNALGTKLREARLQKGWSLAELARAAGINYVTLSRIEGGATAWVGRSILDRLATALGVGAVSLLAIPE